MVKQSRKGNLIMPNKKLTKLQLQQYAGLWLSHTGLNDTEISDTLGVDIDTVASWTKPQKKKTSLLINETFGKKSKTVSIMTKEASQQSDQIKNSVSTSRDMNKNIFRPNG